MFCDVIIRQRDFRGINIVAINTTLAADSSMKINAILNNQACKKICIEMTERCKYPELVKRRNLYDLNIMLMLFDFCGNQPIFVICPGVVTRPVPGGVVVVGMLRTVGP